jgi:hypothetical protein
MQQCFGLAGSATDPPIRAQSEPVRTAQNFLSYRARIQDVACFVANKPSYTEQVEPFQAGEQYLYRTGSANPIEPVNHLPNDVALPSGQRLDAPA